MLDAGWETTLAEPVTVRGIGLHSGRPVACTLDPASGGGKVFVRTDLPLSPSIPAQAQSVVDTRMQTTLGAGPARVSTVEHLLSALSALGVDHVQIRLDGPEVPVLDGSALPWCEAIAAVGIRAVGSRRWGWKVVRPVEVRQGDKWARLEPGPAQHLDVDCSIEFADPLVGRQHLRVSVTPDSFMGQVASARTFGFAHEVEALRAHGLGLGGSLDNAVVVADGKVLNPEGLRWPDECVRHKVLDAVGDLSLAGAPLLGLVRLHKSGHALHVALVQAALEQDDALLRVPLPRSELPPPLMIPSLERPGTEVAA